MISHSVSEKFDVWGRVIWRRTRTPFFLMTESARMFHFRSERWCSTHIAYTDGSVLATHTTSHGTGEGGYDFVSNINFSCEGLDLSLFLDSDGESTWATSAYVNGFHRSMGKCSIDEVTRRS